MERKRNAIEKQRQDYPSFSSTLLDAIYRSIDESDNHTTPSDRIPTKKQNSIFFPEPRRIIPPLITPSVPHPRPRRTATSSSSEASSYGGFSSSDTEPAPARLRPIRTAPAVRSDRFPEASRSDEKTGKKERHGSIRSRLRDLRNGGRSPSSPGARLANFLASIFAAKSKVSVEMETKTPATGKRTVRFCPVSVIVGEDRRPAAAAVAAAVAPARGRVGGEEEEEEEDLFELKNLAVIGRFRDELPVYETTRFGKYSGVSRGVIL